MKIFFLSIVIIGMVLGPIILMKYLLKKKKYPFIKKSIISFLMSLCSLLSFILLLYLWGIIGSLYKVKLNFNIDKFETARAYTFAKILSDKHQKKRLKCVILTGWDSDNEELVKVQIEKIKEGLGESTIVVDVKRVKVKKSKYNGHRYIDVSSEKFNKLLDEYKACNMIISMIGLPWKVHELEVLKRYDKPPVIGLLDGRLRRLEPFIRDGRISLITKYRPDWTLLPNLPDDPVELFKLRYLVIQKSTMNEMQRRHRFWRNFKWL